VTPDQVELIVQGDDFGMCHAVNQGIAAAFSGGILTQASMMAACPWFSEAVAITGRLGLPVGLHQTLTCEWDYLRWGPLTRAPSLCGPDGTFHRTVADAQAGLDIDETVAELLAQAGRARRGGLELRYLDVHMGMVAPAAYAAVAERLGVPFLYPGLSASLRFASIAMLSARKAADKKAWLMAHLDGLGPGRHLVVAHPGVGGPELSSITDPASDVWPWAERYRVSDLAVLTDPDVRGAVDRLGIALTSLDGTAP
jgi:hypothetical protein